MCPFPIARIARALEEAGVLCAQTGALPDSATDLTDDSRAVRAGTIFIAVRGSERDGHAYLPQAAARGAVAAIVEDATSTDLPSLVVCDGRRAAAIAAAAAFDFPTRALRLIGVTGTNGKTTTVGILRHLFDSLEEPAASIGTLGILVGSAGRPVEGGGGLTTPGPVELQRIFRRLADARVRMVAMEVSSHALHQQRVEGVAFDAAVFTNVTRDHLDYHGSMEAYFAAKALLIHRLGPGGIAVVNADAPEWIALPPAPRTVTFSVEGRPASVRAVDVRYEPRGSAWTLLAGEEASPVRLPLIGSFNVSNAVAAATAAWSLGATIDHIARHLGTLPQIPGRLEKLSDHPTVLRDYAHTPDALQRAIAAVRPFTRGRVILVFGCGGDRDRGKRPEMGRIAQQSADEIILTSDNPRTEDPDRILDDIAAGIAQRGDGAGVRRLVDRREAIAAALRLANPDADVVLLAGKGHETYQVRGTIKYPFDEREVVRQLLGIDGDRQPAASDPSAPSA